MSQPFDQATWKARVAAWWRERAPDWRRAMESLGMETAYGMLTASAFLPLLEAYYQSPSLAMKVLVELVGGVGGNLVANVMQGAYDKARSPRMEQEIAESPEMRAGYEALLSKLEVLDVAEAALGDQWAAFETKLREELAHMGGGLRIEAEGGVFLGDVKVDHGNLIVRDKYEYHYHIASDASPPDFTQQWEAYLRHVVKRTSKLTLRGVDVDASDPTRAARPRLAQVYISLDTTTRIGGEALESALAGHEIPWSFETGQDRAEVKRLIPVEFSGRGGREDQLLPALVAVAVSHFAVVLGDPGSGKSTSSTIWPSVWPNTTWTLMVVGWRTFPVGQSKMPISCPLW